MLVLLWWILAGLTLLFLGDIIGKLPVLVSWCPSLCRRRLTFRLLALDSGGIVCVSTRCWRWTSSSSSCSSAFCWLSKMSCSMVLINLTSICMDMKSSLSTKILLLLLLLVILIFSRSSVLSVASMLVCGFILRLYQHSRSCIIPKVIRTMMMM